MRPRFCRFLLFSIDLIVAAAGAETNTAVETAAAGAKASVNALPVPPPLNASAERRPTTNGQISAATAKAIRAGLSAFTPSKTADPAPDDVVVLAKVEVTQKKLRLPSSTDVLTKAGREEFLRKQHPHATAFMLEEFQRLENIKALHDVADTLRTVGRKADSKELEKEIRDAFMRRTNPRDEALDKIYNRGHR